MMRHAQFLLGALMTSLLGAHTEYVIAQPITQSTNMVITPVTAEWNAAFIRGNTAFKVGDYARALTYFDEAYELASREGKLSATLVYNRAVTFYKLRRYDQAKTDFTALIPTQLTSAKKADALTEEERQWADLGRYNLGLIARDQHQHRTAKMWFTQLQQPGTNTRLRELAARQLSSMPTAGVNIAKTSHTTAKKSAFLLSVGAAQDDNASSLADELSSELSQAEDTYLNMLVYGQHYLNGQRGQGVKLYGLAQVRRYEEFESFNSQVLGGGLVREISQKNWTYELGGRLLQSELNSARLSTQYTFNSRAQSQQNQRRAQWEISYQGSWIDASQTYHYIEGWQHQARVGRIQTVGKFTLTPSLGWELNKRDNRRTNTNYYSYSPTIFSAGFALRWDANRDWRLYSQVDWSEADYSGTNRLFDLGIVEKNQSRHYERTQWLIGTRYRISDEWSLKAEYNNITSDDNFALYSFDKNVISLKLDYGW